MCIRVQYNAMIERAWTHVYTSRPVVNGNRRRSFTVLPYESPFTKRGVSCLFDSADPNRNGVLRRRVFCFSVLSANAFLCCVRMILTHVTVRRRIVSSRRTLFDTVLDFPSGSTRKNNQKVFTKKKTGKIVDIFVLDTDNFFVFFNNSKCNKNNILTMCIVTITINYLKSFFEHNDLSLLSSSK